MQTDNIACTAELRNACSSWQIQCSWPVQSPHDCTGIRSGTAM